MQFTPSKEGNKLQIESVQVVNTVIKHGRHDNDTADTPDGSEPGILPLSSPPRILDLEAKKQF